jgi:dephospho-CoA kinase
VLRIGLTGGFATGKSFVGECLVRLGCHLLKADDVGHEVLEPGGAAYAQSVEAFGREILDEEGRIDRRKLGALVFGDPDRLHLLNSFVHPAVVRREEEWFGALQAADPGSIGVVEAAILIETGSYRRFDKIVLVVCTLEQQVERAMRRDSLSREDVLTRLSRQMPLEEKRAYAHWVIDTSGKKLDTEAQVRELYEEIRRLVQ